MLGTGFLLFIAHDNVSRVRQVSYLAAEGETLLFYEGGKRHFLCQNFD